MKLIIEDDEGRRTVIPLFRDELTIGRAEENSVRLTDKDVSRRHARLFRREGQVYLEDLNSLTGVRVNGQRIHGRRPIHEGDLIEISRYDLAVESGPAEKPAARADEITIPIGRREHAKSHENVGVRWARRAIRVTTLVFALLLLAAVVAVLWLRAVRGGP
jgi:ABC transport system ATP-binding/permease protein